MMHRGDDDFVPEEAMDYDEIFRRGGQNSGDENFALFKCPSCNRVYLLEYEVDTVYLDATDLTKRVPVNGQTFTCTGCGKLVPRGAWAGPWAKARFRVTWGQLKASDWAWAAKP
jgi:hypothetical protein